MPSYSRLRIDAAQIARNLSAIPGRVMPMVKGNGYGLGLVDYTRFLFSLGIDIVGVGYPDEARTLRAAGIDGAIYLIAAMAEDAELIRELKLEVAVGEPDTIAALGQLPLHLDLNLGLNRFGCRREEALTLARQIPHLAGVATHFPDASRPEDQVTQLQAVLGQLKSAGIHPRWVHTGLTTHPVGNMTRVGLALLEEAVTLESRLVKIHTCQAGERVGYRGAYRVTRPQERIGIVGIGYHDGLPFQTEPIGHMLVCGKPAPRIGRTCMDFTMINLTDIPEARVGQPVIIFGPELSLHTVAEWNHVNPRALLSQLGPRIQRNWENDHDTLRNTTQTLQKDPRADQHCLPA